MKLAVTTLVFCVTALVALGLVVLYSSTMVQHGADQVTRQAIWCALGLTIAAVLAAVDYARWRRWVWIMYGIAVFLLALVLVPGIGIRVNGASRWLGFGSVRLQPSEFAKLALILLIAWYGERRARQLMTLRGVVKPGLAVGVMLGLVFLEPDVGTTVLMAGLALALFLVAGVSWRLVLPAGLSGAAAVGWYVWQDPVRAQRIFSWVALEETKQGTGFQPYQAMLALGSGGWTGLGLGNGRQKMGFVPEHHTDFIFAVVGEELGLVGTLLVLFLYVTVLWCGLWIALRARDTFGLLLAMGVTLLISMQAIINIGVVTSLFPNKGLPLPFISYGGSSLVVMLAAVGLLLSVARRAPAPLPQSRNPFLPDEEAVPAGS
ncbi:putative lipid II flippase FtsW [Limisphaera sp. VF-2]|jgi:cell division protein FtsW|uniref:putative lipid II flippase FtsW n=1 Tax=Limisphaera sp. VF-2 TaxID=3400418 RepID=UPI0017524E49